MIQILHDLAILYHHNFKVVKYKGHARFLEAFREPSVWQRLPSKKRSIDSDMTNLWLKAVCCNICVPHDLRFLLAAHVSPGEVGRCYGLLAS